MSATQVSISSNALLMLGAKTISAIDEDSDRAQLAANLYESTRNALLRSHPWNCAVKRVVLAPDTTAPAGDYDAAFTVPADCLRILQVGQEGYEVDYKLENGKLLCSGTSLALKYIFRNDVESTWDALLIKAMELTLASEMAYPITQSASMAELMAKKLELFMKGCRAVDGQDDPPQTMGDFPLYQARFGSFRY